MPHTAPTLSEFRTRYGEFAGVGDPVVTAYLGDATGQVSTDWIERDYPKAIMLLTAHMLLVEGAVERAAGRRTTVTTTGPIASKQVGDVRVTYAGAGGSSGGATYPNGYGATEYGRRFYELMRRNFAGPMVV